MEFRNKIPGDSLLRLTASCQFADWAFRLGNFSVVNFAGYLIIDETGFLGFYCINDP